MLSDFLCSAGAASGTTRSHPRTDTRHRVKNAVKKCSKVIKKTSEKLAQTKNLYYLCIKQKNKRPGCPGND